MLIRLGGDGALWANLTTDHSSLSVSGFHLGLLQRSC